MEPVDLNIPTDMSYVFGGSYAPLSCKLVEQVSVDCKFVDITGANTPVMTYRSAVAEVFRVWRKLPK